MDACFSIVGQSRRKRKSVTVEHYYQVDIFTTIIDQQLQELNNRFNEQAIEFDLSSREALRHKIQLFCSWNLTSLPPFSSDSLLKNSRD
jgi:biotin synthase-related radical SAM superfamily protein